MLLGQVNWATHARRSCGQLSVFHVIPFLIKIQTLYICFLFAAVFASLCVMMSDQVSSSAI